MSNWTPTHKILKKNYERKGKNEKIRGQRREIERVCQSMSIIGMYKLLSHFIKPQVSASKTEK